MKPLSGIRVLEVTGFLAGPYSGLLLGHLGAEMIRVEPPAGDSNRDYAPFLGPDGISLEPQTPDDISLIYLMRSRGRQSITLNLKDERGRDLFRRLAAEVDVVLENLAPGGMARLGLDDASLRAANPRLIYCSISGFGQDGPYRDVPAFDPIIQAMSGVMSLIGQPDGPPTRTGVFYLADQVTPLFAVISILSALRQRDLTGQGQTLDVSMMDCLVSLLWMEPLGLYEQLGLPVRVGNSGARHGPMDVYPTQDGWILVLVASNVFWPRLVKALGRPELADDPRYQSNLQRARAKAEIDAIISDWTRLRTTEEALAGLHQFEVPSAKIQFPNDVMADPQVAHRRMFSPVQHPTVPAARGGSQPRFPVLFSETELGPDRPLAPTLGQDNAAIFGGWLGLSDQELADLRAAGVM